MTLELHKIVHHIDDMGQVLAQRAGNRERILPAARALLHHFAEKQEELRAVAESKAGQDLRCASPGDEKLDEVFPAPEAPDRVTIIASDGSQIYPDTHGLALYFAINVGSIIYRHGSGQAPEVGTDPRLYYSDEHVYPGGRQVSGDLVSARRDLAEMRVLADLAGAESDAGSATPPLLALGDGSLIIWLRRANISDRQQEQILDSYISCLDQLRRVSANLASFVSRPYSAEVVSLLYLAQLEPDERGEAGSLSETTYRGLTDRALFGNLDPGQRSALFVRGTATNKDLANRGHSIYFFYLNTGTDLARVEVPEWVACLPRRLDLVHSVVYHQCRINRGYPYVLTRADELAVILGDEREALERLLMQAMNRHGLDLPHLSQKAQQKQVARWRRRH
jgi:hypothetical protein